MGSLVFHLVLLLPLSCCSGMEYTWGFRNSSLGWRVGEVLQSNGSDRNSRYGRWYARAGVASLQRQVHPGWSRRSGTVPLSPSPCLRSSPTHGVCSGHHKDVLLTHFYHMYSDSVGRCVDAFLVLLVGGTSPWSFSSRWSGISKFSSCSG